MSNFKLYSHYYDLLYRDKDYAGEAAYLCRLLDRYAPGARRLLELGCGTGRMAEILAGRGYTLHGVDLSDTMLAMAGTRLAALPEPLRKRLAFSPGDVRAVRLGETFDAVISLFHVMSYQTGNADLHQAMVTAAAHLAPGGVFIFDVWYGPAVLAQRPEVRVRRCEDETMKVLRIAEPHLHPNDNLVDVNFQISVFDKVTGQTRELSERHVMRYLFRPEVDLLLQGAGFELLGTFAWLTDEAPDQESWGACFVARKTVAAG